MRHPWPIALLTTLLLVAPTAWTSAQEETPPPPTDPTEQIEPTGEEPLDVDLTEHTERRLTQIDITIRPKKKAPTEPPELSTDDLEVVVAGKRRELQHVDRVCRVLPGTTEVAAKETEIRTTETPEPAPQAAPLVPNTYVFYLDHTHLTMSGQATALAMTRRMIQELIPNGNKGVVVSSGTKLTQSKLSGDTDYLLSFLDKIAEDRRQWLSVAYADGEEDRYALILNYQESSDESAKNLARMYIREERMYTRRELSRLSATLGALADLDPPKAMIYFADIMRSDPGMHYARFVGIDRDPGKLSKSGGHAGGPGIESMANESHAFDKVTEEAAAHGVRMYTIQAQGLVSGMLGVSSSPGRGSGVMGGTNVKRSPWERTNEAVRTLQSFSLESGGEMFYGGVESATLNKVLNRIESDLSCFYLLSFRSESMREDSPLPVRVRFNQDSPRFEELERGYEIQARGQVIVLSEKRKKESLLLAAHAASETVDSEVGHAAIIPLGFEDGRFHAMAQFMVANPDLPEALVMETSWELGMTHVHREKVANQTDRRITISDPRIPVVLQAAWAFPPGENELTLVGFEDRLGQLVTAQIELDWPDPNSAEAVVTQVAIVQPESAVFVEAEGKTLTGDAPPENRIGSLAIGDGVARVDRPMYFVSLVCRKKKDVRVLWIDRTLVGNVPIEFTRQQWDRTDDERCVRIQDLIRENHVGWGNFEYHVNVYDDPSLEADPIVTRVRKFTAVDPEPPLKEGPTSINFAADPDKTKPARY